MTSDVKTSSFHSHLSHFFIFLEKITLKHLKVIDHPSRESAFNMIENTCKYFFTFFMTGFSNSVRYITRQKKCVDINIL